MRRRALAVLAGPALALLLTGCSAGAVAGPAPTACTLNIIEDHFSVTVTSASTPHPALAICLEASCSPSVRDADFAEGAIRDGKGAVEARLERAATDTWFVVVGPDRRRPAHITFLVGPPGAQVAGRDVALSWHRGDPSDPCHHWDTVDPVRIALP